MVFAVNTQFSSPLPFTPVPPGRYIIAVSGGVDSMSLLDIVRHLPYIEPIIVHVQHGIRLDDDEDEALVRGVATSHNIPYETQCLMLGVNTSEAAARKGRYKILRQYCKKYRANGIITAHHQDDLLETVLINLLRGTGWRGLAPFTRSPDIFRPLLGIKKHHLVGYAHLHRLAWREDSTNTDEKYLRNWVRLSLIPLLDQKDAAWEQKLHAVVRQMQEVRPRIEQELEELLQHAKQSLATGMRLDRYTLIMLPPLLAYELLQEACRHVTGHSLERNLAEAVLVFAKVARTHKRLPLGNDWQVRANMRHLIVEPRLPVVS